MFSIKKSILLTVAAFASIQSVVGEYKNYDECIKPGDFALTFDDGPNSKLTDMVLDVLKKENVKATFFINGKNCMDVANDPEAQRLIKREVDEGHVIASHTYTHPETGITTLTDEQLTSELKTLNDLVFDITGLKLAFFRPPLGEFNEANKKVIESLGFTANVLWNLDSNDWKAGDNATANYFKYLDNANPSTNSFIALNHDIQEVTATYNLQLMIPIIRDLGYHFVTVDECLGMSAYQNVNSLENKGASNTTVPVNATIPTPITTVFQTPTLIKSIPSSNLKSGAEALTYSILSAIVLVFITLFNTN
ncbi:glycoside hydrolase/deacetylase [Neocallimastix lanati (nom. inval.)]|jgi:peptidoglycan/xylan/chitin deacetylase (PgdA/CDA1 family)|uniref:Glycoside hydrolase/deacetylase n=1 Tax=Neocallimastix californiae TaxID=1754190 RepID=A0A1Y1ZPK8_9FUNG|nr:glycoside hydrolase/deacetylase [Neocallimastix sp. JGI-2020a]ORY12166.1 glycoside hydrolase/deacetylase [Neocallimastix californiae]|eukprot:ORY12166.1 glycoside hydrolase/deacetylase [Neocallimastix californiae]